MLAIQELPANSVYPDCLRVSLYQNTVGIFRADTVLEHWKLPDGEWDWGAILYDAAGDLTISDFVARWCGPLPGPVARHIETCVHMQVAGAECVRGAA